jgi:phosphatidylglycerol---prolipoprotein diacylglyceryl transferase
MTASPYSLLMLAGIVGSLVFWSRLAKRDERLLAIYIAALVSAFLGAKVVCLAMERWMFLDALLGGYAGVEVAKRVTGYAQATGAWFAVIAPVGIVLGRVGCLLHGSVWDEHAPRLGGQPPTRTGWRGGRRCRWRSRSTCWRSPFFSC